MDPRHPPRQQAAEPRRQTPVRIAYRGRRLSVVRAVWIALTVSALGLFVVSIPAAYEHFHKPCTGSGCGLWTPSHADSRNLEELNLSLGFYAAYNVILEVLTTLGYLAVGAFIFWRKPEEWMPLLLSLALVLFGIDTLDQLKVAHPVWSLPVAFVQYLGTLCFFVSFYLFPDGRFVPRWTRVPAAIWIAYLVPFYFFPASPLSATQWPPVLQGSLVLALLGTLIFAQTYRYLRVSDWSERQQTKWVVFGFSAAIMLWVGIVLADEVVLFFTQAGDLGVLYTLVSRPAMQLASLLVPLSIGVAIVRYSLWDIDIIINRTLVYGALTTLLGLIYFGGVTLLQGVFRTLTGQGDTLAIVASTLVIAALFTPLRRRIQSFIERRFYRRKYDAAKTLAAFNARLRDETDLNALSAALVEVTQVTMQPEHASLWLRPEAAQKAERVD